jgi:hypothetical protein
LIDISTGFKITAKQKDLIRTENQVSVSYTDPYKHY